MKREDIIRIQVNKTALIAIWEVMLLLLDHLYVCNVPEVIMPKTRKASPVSLVSLALYSHSQARQNARLVPLDRHKPRLDKHLVPSVMRVNSQIIAQELRLVFLVILVASVSSRCQGEALLCVSNAIQEHQIMPMDKIPAMSVSQGRILRQQAPLGV